MCLSISDYEGNVHVRLSVCLSVYQSVHLFVCPSCPSVCPSIRLSVSPYGYYHHGSAVQALFIRVMCTFAVSTAHVETNGLQIIWTTDCGNHELRDIYAMQMCGNIASTLHVETTTTQRWRFVLRDAVQPRLPSVVTNVRLWRHHFRVRHWHPARNAR